MQTEDRYNDLSALFEAQDDALRNDAFVERVMQPIRKRSRWRTPLLFGAGGLGVGAALSQMGGLFDVVNARAARLSQSVGEVQVQAQFWDGLGVDPLWFGAIAVVVISCAAIVATERA
ncbi:MAG: hypothetical protein AAFN91_16590 [Pseudomonadota bacterium]